MKRMTIEEAKAYLKEECLKRFEDSTFRSYIDNKLAGDFSVEVAELIKYLLDSRTRYYKTGWKDGWKDCCVNGVNEWVKND